MADIQNNHVSSKSTGGFPLINLICADGIDLIAGCNNKLQELTDKLSSNASKYDMEISVEKSKVMVNSNDNKLQTDIYLYGSKLEEVKQLIYLGATLTKDGSDAIKK